MREPAVVLGGAVAAPIAFAAQLIDLAGQQDELLPAGAVDAALQAVGRAAQLFQLPRAGGLQFL
ncbi:MULTISPECIES: hypothetical protein [Streptomyces]|uniref:hypothetical protein n=1 Tax=Streptomyces TaxID=1883 RepID=UPI000F7ACF09|nr:hypothetical protein [Streptomyces sp. WAC05858]RSS32514.1 hypothetical protein EF902_46080 [Streptomyces sp. WAC05858]WTA80444.1 hypothetical protein OG751_11155 [Streptomyces antimycoticus]